MGGDRGISQSDKMFSSSVRKKDFGDNCTSYNGWGVGVTPVAESLDTDGMWSITFYTQSILDTLAEHVA